MSQTQGQRIALLEARVDELVAVVVETTQQIHNLTVEARQVLVEIGARAPGPPTTGPALKIVLGGDDG